MIEENQLDKELNALSVFALRQILKGDPVLPSLAAAINNQNHLSLEWSNAFRSLGSRISIGQSIADAFAGEDFFKNPYLNSWVQLVINSFNDPQKAKLLWIDWFSQKSSVPWDQGIHWPFLFKFLQSKGNLWIVGEEPQALKIIVEHCRKLAPNAHFKVFDKDNYESLSIKCKRGELPIQPGLLIMWVESSSNRLPVIAGIDEMGAPMLGTLQPTFTSIYRIEAGLQLQPTGVIPSLA